jgi:hypothetical protein
MLDVNGTTDEKNLNFIFSSGPRKNMDHIRDEDNREEERRGITDINISLKR